MYCFYVWQYVPQWDHNSDYFPGTGQMLKRWDGVYPIASFETDAFSTYHGGWGLFSYALGINAYLGDSLVDALHAQSTPNNVRVHMLCGNENDIPLLHNEHTGPSDGVIFRDSCLDTTGIPNVGGTAVIAANHLESGWHSLAVTQIKSWLAAP
jgi:hypothetical protein